MLSVDQVIQTIPPIYEWPVKFCAATAAATYVLSVVTGNLSQVDRIWTFMPTIYIAYFALLPLWPNEPTLPLMPYTPKTITILAGTDYSPRALLMLGLTTIWMCRLSYNTWRRGLFNMSDEDYRWIVLRQRLPAWFLHVVNLTFIAIIQNIILLTLAMPTQIAVEQPHAPLATSDYILGALALLLVATEFTADNQQYSFQTYKHSGGVAIKNDWPGARIKWTPTDAKRGFVTRGLWAWSRHPNFFCEQSFWCLMTLFPILSPASPNLPKLPLSSLTPLTPLIPAFVITSLFYSSTLFSESISASKYPLAYAAYQQRVGMFVPFLTPVYGAWAAIRGRKAQLDELVYGPGTGIVDVAKKDN